ncbi:MAG TPA: nucleoid-associated protein [Bacteroidales bacterium]|nr:nucleoid-associated protein [Bacteroidales bacterium]
MASKIDTSTILIERVIVHDLPKHKKGETEIEPNYSQNESILSDGLRVFFKEKVIQSFDSGKSFKICFEEENDSPCSWLIDELLNSDGSKIVEQSKELAKYLFKIQVGNNAAGILVIICGKLNSQSTCIILKLERDNGAQLTLDPITKSYNIAEVENLMLTKKTRIFKVAMFIKREIFKTKYDGLIMDHQIDIREKKYATTWFMKLFLGCKAFEDPKITTQHFYNFSRTFIETIEDPLDRAKYIQDLNSYVQKNSPTLSPKEFANDYLKDAKHKNDYRDFLKTKSFSFDTSFLKDTTQIDKQTNKFAVEFENGISIIGKKGTFNKNVILTKLNDVQHRAEVTSKIKRII